MKIIIFMLAIIAISNCQPMPGPMPMLGGYQPIDLSQAQEDSDLQDLIDYGMQNVVQEGMQSMEFTSSSFQLTKINYVYKQVLDGNNYQFNCDFTNDESITIQAEFEIHVDIETQTKTFKSSSYNIVSTSAQESVEESYTEVDSMEVEYSDEIQNVLSYGLENVIEKVKGRMSKSYKITTIKSVYRQIVSTAFFYKCNVVISNTVTEESFSSVYIVYYQPSTDQMSLIDYSTGNGNDNEESNESTESNEMDYGTDDIVSPIEDQYIPIDTSFVDNNEEAKSCLDYGVQQITQIGVSESKFTQTTFTVTQINQAYTQILGDGIFYKYDCDLQNTQGVTVQTTFTVYYMISTSQYKLTTYNYQVSSAQTEIESETSSSSSSSTTTQTSQSSTYTTQITQQTGYSSLSIDSAEEDSTSNDCFEYGFQRVIDKGISQKKIPKSTFTVTKMQSVYKKTVKTGEYYKFTCESQNKKGSVVTMNFVVFYKYKSESYSLKSYSYKVKGASKSKSTQTQINTSKSTYTQISSSEIKHSQDIQSSIQYAMQQVVQNYQSYKVTKTNSVYRKVVDSSIYYKLDVDLTSDEGKTTGLNCIVGYKPDVQEYYVQAYSYKTYTSYTSTSSSSSSSSSSHSSSSSSSHSSSSSSSSTSISTSSSSSSTSYKYTKLSTKNIKKSSKYTSIMNYGVKECIQNLVSSNVVATSDFEVSKVISAFSQKQSSKQENYVFQVQLSNSYGISVNVNFNVNYQSKNSKKVLKSYYVEGTSSSQSEVMVVDYSSQQTQVSTCSSVKSSKTSQAAITYGAQQVAKQVVKKEKLSVSDFKVTKIQSIYSEVVNSNSYKVVATMQNSKKQTIETTYSVDYESSSSKTLNSYSYILY